MAKFFTHKGKVPLFDPDGKQRWIAEDKAVELMRESGWKADLTEETREALRLPKWTRSQILDDPVTAAGMGALSSATFGVSDVATRAALGPDAGAAMAALQQENPYAYAGGEIAGMAIPGGVPGWAAKGAAGLGAKVTAKVAKGAAPGLGARALGHLATGAAGGAAVGAGSGMAQAMATDDPIDMVEVGGKMLEGALVGGALGTAFSAATGTLGAGSRFLGGKAKDLAKAHRYATESKALLAEQSALEKVIQTAQRTGRVAVKDVVRAKQIEVQLGKLAEKTGALKDNVLGGLAESMAGRGVQRMVGSAVGGIAGGPVGFVAGMALGPGASKVLDKVLAPAMRAASATVSKAVKVAERVGASPVARTAGAVAAMAARGTIRPLTTAEFGAFSSELDAMDPNVMAGQLLADMPAAIPPDQQRQIIAAQQQQFGFFQQVFDEIAPKGETAFGKLSRRDPGIEGRIKLTRYLRGAFDPQSLLEDIADGRLTPQVVRANEVLRPQHLQAVRDAVAAKVGLELTRGGTYSLHQERVIATLMGYPSRLSGLGPLNSPGQGEQGKAGGEQKTRRMKKVEEPHHTKLQKLAQEGLA